MLCYIERIVRLTDIPIYRGQTFGISVDDFNTTVLTVPLLQACIDFLKRQMGANTCITLRQFAKTIQSEELKLAADTFILTHFREVANTDDFSKLGFTQVSKS